MARIRSIKQGFFTNEDLADCPPLARLLFSGLWTIADREGRLVDRPRKIKVEILPYDDCDIEELLSILVKKKFIVRYEVEGNKIIQVVNFLKHQQPHYKELPSQLPPPPGQDSDIYVAQPVTKDQRERIFERDGYECQECGSENKLSIDHIIPTSKGGTSDDENLRTLCLSCNSSKGNREAAATINQGQTNVGSTLVQRRPNKSDASPSGMGNGEWSLVNGGGNGASADQPTDPEGKSSLPESLALACKLSYSTVKQATREKIETAANQLRQMTRAPDGAIVSLLSRFGEFFETLSFSDKTPNPSQVPEFWLRYVAWLGKQEIESAKKAPAPADVEIDKSLGRLKQNQQKRAV